MKKRVPLLLALMATWFVGSSYWYTCRIEYACNTKQNAAIAANATQTGTATSNGVIATFDAGDKYGKLNTFYFAPDSSNLIDEKGDQPALEEIATFAKNHSSRPITIKGYTANIANGVDDTQLSRNRADELRQRLQALGVDNQITVIAKGTDEQIGSGQTETELAKNRRATVVFNE